MDAEGHGKLGGAAQAARAGVLVQVPPHPHSEQTAPRGNLEDGLPVISGHLGLTLKQFGTSQAQDRGLLPFHAFLRVWLCLLPGKATVCLLLY